MSTAQRYRQFASWEARGRSAAYEALALAVAGNQEVLQRLGGLPESKRQPNLLFAAVRFTGGPVSDPVLFQEWVLAHWDLVAGTMLKRSTQTNEPGRCAVLLPVLASLPQPLALLEVGASAGLCLYPDAYAYRYRGEDQIVRSVGDPASLVQLPCRLSGPVPIPDHVPHVVWRAGLDLNPLDVFNDEDIRWLQALIWPEHHERQQRLHAAVTIARGDPPLLARGDLLTDLSALAAQAPPDATLVIFHSAVLTYVPPAERPTFIRAVRRLPGHWVSNEGDGVLPGLTTKPVSHGGPDLFLLTLDGNPVGRCDPHGNSLHWLPPSPAQSLE